MTEDERVIWHDVECGAYGADLALWAELAETASWGAEGRCDVLELGTGTGRVALHLARRGHAVWALDSDPSMIAALGERVGGARALTALEADARSFDLGRRFGMIAAPMQLVHLIDATGRAQMLRAVASHLDPGGIAPFALMDDMPEPWRAGAGAPAPLPDVREKGAWIFSSLPVAIEPAGDAVRVRRLRQVVSPEGELREEAHSFELHDLDAERLEAEARSAGLVPRERREVPETDDHVGSTVVILEHGE